MTRYRLGGLLLLLAAAYLVGCFPTGPDSLWGSLHGLGAGLSIIGGAVLLTVLALVMAAPHPRLAAFTGVCALVASAGCILAFAGVAPFGLVERAAVDAVIVWQIGAGLLVVGARPPLRDTA